MHDHRICGTCGERLGREDVVPARDWGPRRLIPSIAPARLSWPARSLSSLADRAALGAVRLKKILSSAWTA